MFRISSVSSIPAHIGRFIAGEPTVFHEIVSNDLHLDIYCWAPTKHRNLWTFVTVGMSAHEMNIPAGYEYYRRTELVATAPGHWPGLTEIQQMPQSRSEEHTSELQSRGHLVCRLLLEKK